MKWEDAVKLLKKNETNKQLVLDCFFDDPLIQAAERYFLSNEWLAIKSFLPKKAGIALDVGAGRGITSYAIAKEGWHTIAIDPDLSLEVGIEAIKLLTMESGLSIKAYQSYGESIPFPDETFDLVHCRQVLHHSKNLKKICSELSRVLKKGGVFIATREHVISNVSDLPVFLAAHPLHKYYGGENAFLLKEYLENIKSAGIHLTSILNPYASDINLAPETKKSLKTKIANKVYFPWPMLIPDFILPILGNLINTPGRIYTFVGNKL